VKAPNYRLATPSETKCLDCVFSYKTSPRAALECLYADGNVTGKHTCDRAKLFEYEEDEVDEDQLRLEANAEARMENDRDLQLEDGAA
jgi:hypothetical protein